MDLARRATGILVPILLQMQNLATLQSQQKTARKLPYLEYPAMVILPLLVGVRTINIFPHSNFQVFALKAQITTINDRGLQACSFGEALPFFEYSCPIEGLFTNLSFNFRFVKTALSLRNLLLNRLKNRRNGRSRHPIPIRVMRFRHTYVSCLVF
jgi:hypothetical protein